MVLSVTGGLWAFVLMRCCWGPHLSMQSPSLKHMPRSFTFRYIQVALMSYKCQNENLEYNKISAHILIAMADFHSRLLQVFLMIRLCAGKTTKITKFNFGT